MIVNTASECGFPCNQFANQELGSEEDIREFCTRNFGVTFSLFEELLNSSKT